MGSEMCIRDSCLSVCLRGCLCFCLSVCLAVCLSVWLAVWLSGCLAIWLSGYLAIWLAGWLAGFASRTGFNCCRSIRWFFSLGAFESSDGLPNCRILLAEFAERKLGSGGFGELQVCLRPGVSSSRVPARCSLLPVLRPSAGFIVWDGSVDERLRVYRGFDLCPKSACSRQPI